MMSFQLVDCKTCLVMLFVLCFSECIGQLKNAKTDKDGIVKNLYVLDSAGYSNFIRNEKAENLTSVIYGLFINDSTQIRPLILTNEVPTCYSVMNGEIRRLLADSAGLLRQTNLHLFTSSLHAATSGKQYESIEWNKRALVLLYSKKIVKKFRKFYKDALIFCEENKCNIFIISLDPDWRENRSSHYFQK